MKQVLPEPPVQIFERITPPVKQRENLPIAAAEIAPKKPKIEFDDVEEDVSDLDSLNFGEIATPYLKPYQ